jgi:hypothetical protein
MKRFGPVIAIGTGTAVAAAVILAIALGGGSGESAAATVPAGTPVPNSEAPTTSAPEVQVTDFDRSQLPGDLENVSRDWTTDFSRTIIEYDELLLGIRAAPIRDRIRPIDDPSFVPLSDSDHVAGREPGLSLEIGGDARFYPLSILTAHEIVNDVVGGTPVAPTW